MGLIHAWDFTKSLFDLNNLEKNIKEEIPKGRGRYGLPSYGAGILLFLFSLFILSTLSIVFYGFLYDTLSDSYFVVTSKPEITYGFFITSVIYFGLLMFPYLFIGSLIYQGCIFALLKLMGSKGSFKKQYFVTSYIALALGVGSLGFIVSSILGVFLPCLNLFFLLIFLGAGLYLVFYVQGKMLVEIHKTSLMIVMISILIVSIGSLIAFIGVNLLVEYFDLMPDFTATFTIEGINQSISIPAIDDNGNATLNITNTTNTTNTSG
jgi:hypothetical protein